MSSSSGDRHEAEAPSELMVCLWCTRYLEAARSVKEKVCLKCYQLLLNAGLKETEILEQKEPKSKFAGDSDT